MRFDYALEGSGWATATLKARGVSVKLTASYLSDALGDLLAAVVRLMEGADQATCTWQEEPGEYVWEFHRYGGQLHLRVIGADFLPGFGKADTDARNGVQVDVQEKLRGVVTPIVQAAEDVLDRHGVKGYKKLWVLAPFPEKTLAQAKRLLAERGEPQN